MTPFKLSQIGILCLTLVSPPVFALKSKPGRLIAPAFAEARECTNRPEFLTETRTEVPGGLEALPKTVLVARDAEMWIEGKLESEGKAIRAHSYQSFVRAKTRHLGRILCGSSSEEFADRFSLHAPTLIDISEDKKVGNSFWQFQIIGDGKNFSAWNKKSGLFSAESNLEKSLKDLKAQYRLYQIGHNEFELLVQKETGGVLQTLSIRYEALR